MSHRISINLEDEVWASLSKVPSRERGLYVNNALKSRMGRQNGEKAARRMDALREKLPKVKSSDFVTWIREDRER